MEKIIGLKELRKNVERYAKKVEGGDSFVVMRRSKPLFRISRIDENNDLNWETVVDFTQLKEGGIEAKKLLKYL